MINSTFSFPTSDDGLLAPPDPLAPKSRAHSMSDDKKRPGRQHFHAHRRSAAVSEDLTQSLKGQALAKTVEKPPAADSKYLEPPLTQASRSVAFSEPASPQKRDQKQLGQPLQFKFSGDIVIPDNLLGVDNPQHSPSLEIPPELTPTSVNSSPVKNSPRRKTMSLTTLLRKQRSADVLQHRPFTPTQTHQSSPPYMWEESDDDLMCPRSPAPCIDLDDALYSKTVASHRRSESLPSGLKSPFLSGPRPIEPVEEEPEDSTLSLHKNAKPLQGKTVIPRSSRTTLNYKRSSSPVRTASPYRERTSRPSSPVRGTPKSGQARGGLRAYPSVSSLAIPDSPSSCSFSAEAFPAPSIISCASQASSFPLGEPAPLGTPPPEIVTAPVATEKLASTKPTTKPVTTGTRTRSKRHSFVAWVTRRKR